MRGTPHTQEPQEGPSQQPGSAQQTPPRLQGHPRLWPASRALLDPRAGPSGTPQPGPHLEELSGKQVVAFPLGLLQGMCSFQLHELHECTEGQLLGRGSAGWL